MRPKKPASATGFSATSGALSKVIADRRAEARAAEADASNANAR